MTDKNADATQADADADAQSQADTTTPETQADSDDTISLEKAKELRSEAANLRKRLKDAETKAQAAEKATKDREDAEAKEQGKWQELAEKRDADLSTTKSTLATATTELETLRSYVNADVETVTRKVKEIKDDPAAKLLLEFHPGDDASVPQLLEWAKKAKAGLANITTKQRARGAGFDPAPGNPRDINEQQEVAKVRQRPGFRAL